MGHALTQNAKTPFIHKDERGSSFAVPPCLAETNVRQPALSTGLATTLPAR